MQLISIYEKKLLNLTVRIEKIEQDTISYTELDFELIKIEVREMEKLIQQLKVGFVGSTVIIDQLEVEVRNEIPSHGLIIKSLWGASARLSPPTSNSINPRDHVAGPVFCLSAGLSLNSKLHTSGTCFFLRPHLRHMDED